MPPGKVIPDQETLASSHNEVYQGPFAPLPFHKLEGAELSAAMEHNRRMGAEFRDRLYSRPEPYAGHDSLEEIEAGGRAKDNHPPVGLSYAVATRHIAETLDDLGLSFGQCQDNDATDALLDTNDTESILTRFMRAFALRFKEEDSRFEEVETCGIDPKLVAPFDGALDRAYLNKILVGNGVDNFLNANDSNAGVQQKQQIQWVEETKTSYQRPYTPTATPAATYIPTAPLKRKRSTDKLDNQPLPKKRAVAAEEASALAKSLPDFQLNFYGGERELMQAGPGSITQSNPLPVKSKRTTVKQSRSKPKPARAPLPKPQAAPLVAPPTIEIIDVDMLDLDSYSPQPQLTRDSLPGSSNMNTYPLPVQDARTAVATHSASTSTLQQQPVWPPPSLVAISIQNSSPDARPIPVQIRQNTHSRGPIPFSRSLPAVPSSSSTPSTSKSTTIPVHAERRSQRTTDPRRPRQTQRSPASQVATPTPQALPSAWAEAASPSNSSGNGKGKEKMQQDVPARSQLAPPPHAIYAPNQEYAQNQYYRQTHTSTQQSPQYTPNTQDAIGSGNGSGRQIGSNGNGNGNSNALQTGSNSRTVNRYPSRAVPRKPSPLAAGSWGPGLSPSSSWGPSPQPSSSGSGTQSWPGGPSPGAGNVQVNYNYYNGNGNGVDNAPMGDPALGGKIRFPWDPQ